MYQKSKSRCSISYDAVSRLTELVYRNATSVLGNITYQHDAAGKRTQAGGSFARTLLPDPVASASYDAVNRQYTFGDKQMAFDVNGNVASMTDPSGVTSFNWDARNRLKAMNGPQANASFTYDPFGRRVSKTINGQGSKYLYDGDNIVRELRNGTTLTMLSDLGIDQPLVRGGNEQFLTDAFGSTIALTDMTGKVQMYRPLIPMNPTAKRLRVAAVATLSSSLPEKTTARGFITIAHAIALHLTVVTSTSAQ